MDDKKQEIRTRILDCAREHFFKYGISGVSMNTLARELAIGKSTIYQFFQSKEELVSEIIDTIALGFQNEIYSILSSHDLPVPSQIVTLIKSRMRINAQITPSFIRDIKQNPVLNDKINSMQQEFGKNIRIILEEGQKSGIIRPEVNVEFTAEIMPAIFDYAQISKLVISGGMSFEQVLHEAFSILFIGIINNAPAQPKG